MIAVAEGFAGFSFALRECSVKVDSVTPTPANGYHVVLCIRVLEVVVFCMVGFAIVVLVGKSQAENLDCRDVEIF